MLDNQQVQFNFNDDEKHLIFSSTATAVYRVYNNGPAVLNIFVNTGVEAKATLKANQSADIGAQHLHVQRVGNQMGSGWYQFVTLASN